MKRNEGPLIVQWKGASVERSCLIEIPNFIEIPKFTSTCVNKKMQDISAMKETNISLLNISWPHGQWIISFTKFINCLRQAWQTKMLILKATCHTKENWIKTLIMEVGCGFKESQLRIFQDIYQELAGWKKNKVGDWSDFNENLDMFLLKSLLRNIFKFHVLMTNFGHFLVKMSKSVNKANFGWL